MNDAGLAALDHLVIVVADLDAATGSYATLLGRSPSWRGSHPGQGTENTLFRLSNTYLELIAPTAEGAMADILRARLADGGRGGGQSGDAGDAGDAGNTGGGEGLVAMAFQAPDLEGFRAALERGGVDCSPAQPGSGRDRRTGAERSWRSAWVPAAATRSVPIFAIAHYPGDSGDSGALPVAELAVREGESVERVDHVVVVSTDVEASRAVYGDVLGLRLALDREFPDRDVRLLFFRVGGLTVEVAGKPTAASAADQRPDRLWGLAYRVADIEALRARLLAAGVDVSATRRGHKKGTRVCTVRSATHGVASLLIGPDGRDG